MSQDTEQKRMTTLAVLDAVAREREKLGSAIDRAADRATTLAVTGEWTAQDVLAHLVHFAGQLAWALGAPMHPPPWVEGVTERLSGDEWSARAVAHYRGMSLAEVRRDLNTVVDALVARLRTRSDEQMNATDAIPRAEPWPLWRQVGTDTFLHWPVHVTDIEQALAAVAEVR